MDDTLRQFLNVRARLGMGPCAKKEVGCVIVAPDGQKFAGANLCEEPRSVCPREPGEGYEKCQTVCRQIGHAETVALKRAGKNAVGATAWVYGHTHACRDCQEALYGAGVILIGVRDE